MANSNNDYRKIIEAFYKFVNEAIKSSVKKLH